MENKKRTPAAGERQKLKKRKAGVRFLKRWHAGLLSALVLAFVLISDLANIILPDRGFSDNENRTLAAKPAFSLQSLKTGDYFDDLSSYLSDQFYLRDGWLSLNLAELKFIGRKESGGVFLGRDGYLLEKPEVPDQEAVGLTLEAIKGFAERHADLNIKLLLAPCAAAVCACRPSSTSASRS